MLKVLGGAAVVTSGSVCIERVLNQPLQDKYSKWISKLKPPLRAALAKQNRVGYSSIDIVAELYSHSFQNIIAPISEKCK